ncbi:hypothetical protein V5799_034060, partial [Amblyomma americanum]
MRREAGAAEPWVDPRSWNDAEFTGCVGGGIPCTTFPAPCLRRRLRQFAPSCSRPPGLRPPPCLRVPVEATASRGSTSWSPDQPWDEGANGLLPAAADFAAAPPCGSKGKTEGERERERSASRPSWEAAWLPAWDRAKSAASGGCPPFLHTLTPPWLHASCAHTSSWEPTFFFPWKKGVGSRQR